MGHGGGIITSMRFSLLSVVQPARQLLAELSQFPWQVTARTLRARFRSDHLGLTASSLTFTTVVALVPFFTVALAVFTAFPLFAELQVGLQRWLVQSLVPETIARQVLGYLTQFATKASGLGAIGFSFLLVTALTLILTVDRTLNHIWRVRRLRPLGQRVLIYWAAITLGPLLLGASLALTSYVTAQSRGLVQGLPGGMQLLFDTIEFLTLAAGMSLLYHFVPNTPVKWRHAWVGGLFVAAGIEIAKRVLALYLTNVPTYSVLYGAFATLPILLIWMYVAWVIVLLGAVVTAYLPSLLAGVERHANGPGWPFQLAVELLQALHGARGTPAKGLRVAELAQELRVDALALQPALATLEALDWIGAVSDAFDAGGSASEPGARYLLLVDPATTPLAPLLQHLLLPREESLQPLWTHAHLAELKLADALLLKRELPALDGIGLEAEKA